MASNREKSDDDGRRPMGGLPGGAFAAGAMALGALMLGRRALSSARDRRRARRIDPPSRPAEPRRGDTDGE